MGIQRSLTVSGWFAAADFLLVLTAAAQSNLPDGPGKSVVEKVCSGCHAFTVITQVHATKEHWEAVVEETWSHTRGRAGKRRRLDKEWSPTSPPTLARPTSRVKGQRQQGHGRGSFARRCRCPRRAQNAIVQHRTKNGSFKNLEALKSVPGIDVKRIDEKKDWIEF